MTEALPPAFHEEFVAALRDSRDWDHFVSTIRHYLESVQSAGDAAAIPENVYAGVADIIYDNARVSGQIRIPCEAAGLFQLGPADLGTDPRWTDLIEQASQALSAAQTGSEPWFYHLFQLVSLTAMVRGIDRALIVMIDLLTQVRAVNQETCVMIGDGLAAAGWFEFELPKTREHLGKWISERLGKDGLGVEFINVLPAVGFVRGAPMHWLEHLFSNTVLPILKGAAKTQRFDLALTLEYFVYVQYAQKIETRDHYHSVMSRLLPVMRRVGIAQRQISRGSPVHAVVSDAPPLVAFFLHSSRMVGHMEAFLSMLRGAHESATKRIRPFVYLAGDKNVEITDLFDQWEVPYVFVSDISDGSQLPSRNWLAIRDHCRRQRVDVFVFVSNVIFMAFAFALPLAPRQIWWSMKYHCLSLPEIDGYLALGSFQDFKEIEGRRWRVCHRAMEALYDPGLEDAAGEIRAELRPEKDTILLGCLGREEKLLSPAYIRSLAQIMGEVPNALFIWTGKIERGEVIRCFRSAGIAERCRYVGWIDTRLYAQVLDVFVDSFPFASGLTAFETMAAGRPVVAMVTDEALETGFPNHIWPAYSGADNIPPEIHREIRALFTDRHGRSLLPIVENEADYVDFAIRLAKDEGFRGDAGLAAKNFVARYMHDEKRMAETAATHILEIANNPD